MRIAILAGLGAAAIAVAWISGPVPAGDSGGHQAEYCAEDVWQAKVDALRAFEASTYGPDRCFRCGLLVTEHGLCPDEGCRPSSKAETIIVIE
jgi:hypothetical protein